VVVPRQTAPLTDTSTRDVAIGTGVFLVLLVVYFFVRNAFVHHLVVRRVAPSSAGSAGWLLFVGLAFLSAAVVLAMVNAGKYLTFGVTAPLVIVGVVALVAALFTGRR
jgi:fatty acid desaturase